MRIAFEAALAVLLFACIPVVVRTIDANPYTIGIFRLGVASVLLASFMAVRGSLRRVAPRDLLRLAVIGLLFFGHWLTLFLAIKASSASIAAIGQSTYGVDLLLLGAVFRKLSSRASVEGSGREGLASAHHPPGSLHSGRDDIRSILAVLVAAAGAVLVVPSFDLRNDTALGMLLACVSALLYASLPLLHQRWAHISSAMRALGQFVFAFLFFLLFAGKADWNLAPRDWAGLLFLAIGVTVVAHSLWVRVTTRLAPSVTSLVYYGNIPIAIALGVLILGEALTPRTMIGAALIIAGSVFGLTKKL